MSNINKVKIADGSVKDVNKYYVKIADGTSKACEALWVKVADNQSYKVWVNEIIYGEWSAWQDTAISAIPEQREVQTRIIYRYQVWGSYQYVTQKIFKKCWSKSSTAPNCESCGSKPSGGFGFWRGDWADSRGEYNCHGSFYDYKEAWGYNGVLDAVSGWMESLPSGANKIEQKTQYSYRVRIN